VQRPPNSVPRGRPVGQTPLPVGPALQPLMSWLHDRALQEAVTWNLKLEVGGSQTRWPLGHVARPAGQHLACY
jgi:hypothetical protein